MNIDRAIINAEILVLEAKQIQQQIDAIKREIKPIKDFLKNNKDSHLKVTIECFYLHGRGGLDFNCKTSRTIVYPMLKKTIRAHQRERRNLEKIIEKLVEKYKK